MNFSKHINDLNKTHDHIDVCEIVHQKLWNPYSLQIQREYLLKLGIILGKKKKKYVFHDHKELS